MTSIDQRLLVHVSGGQSDMADRTRRFQDSIDEVPHFGGGHPCGRGGLTFVPGRGMVCRPLPFE